MARPVDQASTPAEEKIEAVRICLHGAERTMAVVGEFRTADRVLAAWLECASCVSTFDFQVTFCDGFVFCGCYRNRKRKRGRPALSKFVQAELAALMAAQPTWLPDLARYSVDS